MIKYFANEENGFVFGVLQVKRDEIAKEIANGVRKEIAKLEGQSDYRFNKTVHTSQAILDVLRDSVEALIFAEILHPTVTITAKAQCHKDDIFVQAVGEQLVYDRLMSKFNDFKESICRKVMAYFNLAAGATEYRQCLFYDKMAGYVALENEHLEVLKDFDYAFKGK